MTEDVRIQVDASQRRHTVLVVGAEPEGQPAALANLVLKIGDQSAADALALVPRIDDQRVELPDVAVVLGDTADPAEDDTVVADSDAGDPVLEEARNRLADRLRRRSTLGRLLESGRHAHWQAQPAPLERRAAASRKGARPCAPTSVSEDVARLSGQLTSATGTFVPPSVAICSGRWTSTATAAATSCRPGRPAY
jgi:hypothetical protein